MKLFHCITLALATGLLTGLSACVSDEVAAGPDWLEERAALAARRPPPVHVPVHTLPPGALIEVRATARLLMERGEYVRERARAIAERSPDTEAFVRESLARATPPDSGSR